MHAIPAVALPGRNINKTSNRFKPWALYAASLGRRLIGAPVPNHPQSAPPRMAAPL
jgi:hypothetical protein